MSINKIGIELLAPAKNLSCGLTAINHGADAVYIGGPGFGARKQAGNSLADIETLIKHAHLYKSKVFVAINTLLFDNELDDANALIHQVYNAGADAVIIQDLGLLETTLPPIPIHASTQLDNRTSEKVQFLEQVGFDQVVLARELSLDQIKQISSSTKVRLEYFIHGALCVCYSGQCYMSAAINSRSANRGECGQPCRLKYSLKDKQGTILQSDKHLLSMKDLNLDAHLESLIDAGITSFKIEGRLKDEDYVANVTAHYRKKLDAIINQRPELSHDSSGFMTGTFEPDPQKSFNRGFTSYFVNGRQKGIWSLDTPKSIGEKIGHIVSVKNDHFIIDTKTVVKNGDGLCFFSRKKELIGVKVNTVDGNRVYPNQMLPFYTGATLFRNFDTAFQQALKRDDTQRKISVDVLLEEKESQFEAHIKDEDAVESTVKSESLNPSPATNQEVAFMQIKQQLAKMGSTPFHPNSITLDFKTDWFFPAKALNGLRRELTDQHEITRLAQYQRKTKQIEPTTIPYLTNDLGYEGNVINNKAKQFYERHGVKTISWGFEKQMIKNNLTVMTTKHCILDLNDQCLKLHPEAKNLLPLTLYNDKDTYQLEFDCVKCEMKVLRNKM